MAVLRNGKNTRIANQKNERRSKTKDLFKKYKLKECVVQLSRLNTHQINSGRRYNLRSQSNSQSKPSDNKIITIKSKKQVAVVSNVNIIWNGLISRQYVMCPGVIVLAKMSNYKPWPARINTIYKVGDVLKCFVLFYGTFQKEVC